MTDELMEATATSTQPPKPLSVFINQLDGGYTINLQGNDFYPVKVCVTIDEVTKIVTDFFNQGK